MRGDFSRFADDSFKRYLAAFMQQGRVQLDADWNENVINFLNMLWKQSRDILGASACIGDSFRIGKDIPIDHMLQASLWKPVDKSDSYYLSPGRRGYIFLNTNDRPRTNIHSTNEKASIFVQNAKGILREFNNLDLSRFKSIYIRFKVTGRSFQIAICRKCKHPYKKGEQQYCTHCGAELRGEIAQYSDKNNNNSSSNIKSGDIPALTLRLYSRKEEKKSSSTDDEDKYEYEGQFIELPDADNFFKVKFDLLHPRTTATSSDEHDISHISKLVISWDRIDDDTPVCIGLISAEPMALIVSADTDANESNSWANITNAITNGASGQKKSISNTYKGKPTIKKEKGKEMKWSFSRPANFNSINVLRFAISSNTGNGKDDLAYSNPTLFLVNSNNMTLEYSLAAEQNELSTGIWRSYSVNIKNPKDIEGNVTADALNEIHSIGLRGLPEHGAVFLSEILGEFNFESNFLISGDIELNHLARMYVNGILCSMGHWDTYLTQKHISSTGTADYFVISSNVSGKEDKDDYDIQSQQEQHEGMKKETTISYMVYADVWNRGITHLEDPQIREIALGGADTATRLQTICQIKLKEIPDQLGFHDKIHFAEEEIEKMNMEGTGGRLSTTYPSNSSLTNFESNFGTLGNHLYRIQIHDSGEGEMKSNNNNNNNNITFKWSKDNASLAFAIKKLSEYEVVLEHGGRRLDNVFRIGGLIEIIDDMDELSEQPRGEMRRITHIDVSKNTLSWSSGTNLEQSGVNYLHKPVKIKAGRYQSELHGKVILWDGIEYVNTKEERGGVEEEEDSSYNSIPLDGSSVGNDDIRLKFDPGIFRSGHYWTFITRSNGGVEILKSAKPIGPKHDYALLSLIRKETGKEIEIIEDLRRTFQPLANLRAIDIPYDNGDQLHSGPKNVQAAIQRLSEERTYIITGENNTINASIKELLIEAGEIQELKSAQRREGTFAATISFNDIYQHKPFLIYAIKSGNRWDVKHRIHMLASDDEGTIFKDPVDDGTKNYAWKGFEIEADENAQMSWLAIGDSYTYIERFVKKILDEVFQVIFGADTDQLRADSSVLDAWYKKDLRNLSDSGPELARQAKEHWETLQNDWDRFVRKIDKQMRDFQQNAEEAFDEDEEKKENRPVVEERAAPAGELPTPPHQTIKCPQCGQSYPRGRYTFCTKCRTKLPNE